VAGIGAAFLIYLICPRPQVAGLIDTDATKDVAVFKRKSQLSIKHSGEENSINLAKGQGKSSKE
jgi:hypothetical protein